MAKKYILKAFAPGNSDNSKKINNNLFTLSNVNLNTNNKLIKNSLSIGASQSGANGDARDYVYNGEATDDYGVDFYSSVYGKYRDITKVNGEYIAFFNQSYQTRRDYLREFSQNGEINFVLETIADESIVFDDNQYFCELDLTKLKTALNASYPKSEELITTCKKAFKRIYNLYGWNESNDAWYYYKKFLIDGFLAFEIIFEYDKNKNAKNIIAFKELDPITLEPMVVNDKNGEEIKVWYQFRGDAERQRIIPDSNIIYISWAKGNFADCTRVSYLEGLTKSFNVLRQLENSRIIWNIQNSQKRIKISVPVGNLSPDRQRQRISELEAYYNEDVFMDDSSGEVTVNGMPKFSFNKTYIFPSGGEGSPDISEIEAQGYDLNSIETLKYFWRRFVLETKVPANRFLIDPTNQQGSAFLGDQNITREEYTFDRFIQRIQSIFKELILKPLWIQVCLKMPELAASEYFKTYLGIIYNEENLFTLAKERQILNDSTQTISSLMGLSMNVGGVEKPVFSPKFLCEKYLGISEEDWQLNLKYLRADELDVKNQQNNAQGQGDENMNMDEAGGFGMPEAGGGFGPMSPEGGEMGGEPNMGGPYMGGPSDMGGGEPTGGDFGAPDMNAGSSPEEF